MDGMGSEKVERKGRGPQASTKNKMSVVGGGVSRGRIAQKKTMEEITLRMNKGRMREG